MTIPVSTTTISVFRPDASADTYESDEGPTLVANAVRAHIGSPRGRGSERGGQQSTSSYRLTSDPVDLRHTDVVRDDFTGTFYSVVWTYRRVGLNVDHVSAELQLAEGAN